MNLNYLDKKMYNIIQMNFNYILLLIVVLLVVYKTMGLDQLIENYYPWWGTRYPWFSRRWRYPYYRYRHYPYYYRDGYYFY